MLTLDEFVKYWEAQQLPGSDGKSPRYWPGCVKMAAGAIQWMKGLIDWPPEKVLEIGCCDGQVLELFEKEGVWARGLFGITLFQEEIDLLRSEHPKYNAGVISMHSFYPPFKFDLVMAQRTLEHSPVGFYLLYRMMSMAKRWVLIGQAPWPDLVADPRHYSQLPAENIWNWVNKLGGKKIGQLDKYGVWFLIDTSGMIDMGE